ncbi:MAG: hypothetical protein R3E95_21685 [Thiolinea sp.]
MMLMGVPKEIKNHEYRVGLTPESVLELKKHGHEVLIERDAGVGIGADNHQYRAAGAEIVEDAEEVFARAGMIVKVKEPQAVERALLREGQLLYTYLHLALIRSKPVIWSIPVLSALPMKPLPMSMAVCRY